MSIVRIIFDYKKDDSAISIQDQKVVVKGREIIMKSTAGWDICCECEDSPTLWEKLSNLTELHPIHLLNMP